MQIPRNLTGLGAMPAEPQTAVGAANAAAGEAAGTMPGAEQASPEEQARYEEFVASSAVILYDKQAATGFLATMKKAKDPKAAVGALTAQITTRVASAMREAGRPVPTEAILQGLGEVAAEVMEFADEAGIFPFSQRPDDAQHATIIAYDQTRQAMVGAGLVSQEEAQADWQEVRQMANDPRALQMMGLPGPQGGAGGGGGAMPAEDGAAPMTRQQRRRQARRAKRRGQADDSAAYEDMA